ncbi:MAG: hypothetical protein WCG26_03035, partial [Chloroflexales bacterium]
YQRVRAERDTARTVAFQLQRDLVAQAHQSRQRIVVLETALRRAQLMVKALPPTTDLRAPRVSDVWQLLEAALNPAVPVVAMGEIVEGRG